MRVVGRGSDFNGLHMARWLLRGDALTQRAYPRALLIVAIVASIATSMPRRMVERNVDVAPGILTVGAPAMTRRFRLTTSLPYPSLHAATTLVFATAGPDRTTPDVPIRVTLSAVDAKDIEPVVFDTTAGNAQAWSSPRESLFL